MTEDNLYIFDCFGTDDSCTIIVRRPRTREFVTIIRSNSTNKARQLAQQAADEDAMGKAIATVDSIPVPAAIEDGEAGSDAEWWRRFRSMCS